MLLSRSDSLLWDHILLMTSSVFLPPEDLESSRISESYPTVEHEGNDSLTFFPEGWEQDKMETRVEWRMGEGNLRTE